METARAAAVRGNTVDLYERDDVLGGRLFDAGVHSFKESIRELNAWYRLQMKELNVNVHLGTEMTAEKIRELDADAVVLSVGSEPLMPRAIRGIDTPKAVSCVDVLTGKCQVGEKVVIVGGGLVGAEMAYDYGLEGKKVVLVEALDSLMSNDPNGIPYWVRDMLIELLDRVHCDVRTGCKLECINEKGAVIAEKDGTTTELEADQVIMAIGFRARPSMARELYGCGKEIYEITVGNGIGNIATQVSSAYEIARKL